MFFSKEVWHIGEVTSVSHILVLWSLLKSKRQLSKFEDKIDFI